MISKEFIENIAKLVEIKQVELVEKDLYLQGLLLELSKDKYFADNFAFKGGTCLTKVHSGYYRFSEDLDFTWINSEAFNNQTNTQIRKTLSKEINKLIDNFVKVAKTLELDFKNEKSNKHYVQLGGSNRFVTFKFWYKPINSETPTFIKIQLNFLEKLIHTPKKQTINPIYKPNDEKTQMEYPAYAPMATKTTELYCYSLEEIAAEKVRALLTRRGFKARDLVDLYELSKKGITLKSIKDNAITKTKFIQRQGYCVG